ncbi:archease [Candidatus Aerophobetes bacterium]|nr:archease [Candidatus Aerophobetes bacterium]
MKKYELIDHTADIGVKVRGKSVGELFENAAYAMFDLIADLDRVEKREVLEVEIEGEGMDELLADWLRELLYKFNGERHLLKDFKIEEIDQKSLKARVRGEKLDLSRHSLKMEIKAVTYYGLEIKRTSEGWQAQVIFDV